MDLYRLQTPLGECGDPGTCDRTDGAPDRLGSYRTPVDDVRAFLGAEQPLRDPGGSSQDLWREAKLDRRRLFGDLRRHLLEAYNVETKVRPPELLGATLGQFDYRPPDLHLETLLPSARLFHLGGAGGLLGQQGRIGDRRRSQAGEHEAEGLLTNQLAGYSRVP